jgi:hypothetical protein
VVSSTVISIFATSSYSFAFATSFNLLHYTTAFPFAFPITASLSTTGLPFPTVASIP